MRDIDRAKEIYSISDYMRQNYNSKIVKDRIDKCPFCRHKSKHLSIIKGKLLYSFNSCIGTMDLIKLFQYEGLTEDEAINKLLVLSGVEKDGTIKKVEVKKAYDFKNFYNYLTNEYKRRVKIKELFENIKVSRESKNKIDLELEFFDELTDKIIYETSDKQLEEIECIKNNFIKYFNKQMKLKYLIQKEIDGVTAKEYNGINS